MSLLPEHQSAHRHFAVVRSTASRRPAPFRVALLAGTVFVLTGCAGSGETSTPPTPSAASAPAGTATTSPDAAEATHGAHGDAAGLPSEHVHGVAVNPADERVYLATHEGLFRYDKSGPTRVGPVIDLMGFTVAGPDHFYASGHPGPGTDLPEPVGLIESTDAGATWTPLSRQGESDFHALAASTAGVIGFDGAALRITTDNTTWRELDPPVAPYALATSPDGSVLLATSQSGPIRSTDGGATWRRLADAPLLQVVDWADDQTLVGITPDGTVAVSDNAGATWTERGSIGSSPQAVGAHPSKGGGLRVLAVTAHTVLDSIDGGATFAPLDPA